MWGHDFRPDYKLLGKTRVSADPELQLLRMCQRQQPQQLCCTEPMYVWMLPAVLSSAVDSARHCHSSQVTCLQRFIIQEERAAFQPPGKTCTRRPCPAPACLFPARLRVHPYPLACPLCRMWVDNSPACQPWCLQRQPLQLSTLPRPNQAAMCQHQDWSLMGVIMPAAD